MAVINHHTGSTTGVESITRAGKPITGMVT